MAATASPLCNGQQEQEEVKRLPEPSAREKSPPALDNNPPQIAGYKRKRRRSQSPSEDFRKRLLPLEESDNREFPQPLDPGYNWHCPRCGLPCWRCHSSSRVTQDRRELCEDPVSEPESMEPPSVPASAASLTTSDRSVSSGGKRKRSEARKLIYVGPKDDGFQELILGACGLDLQTFFPSHLTPSDVFGLQSQTVTSRVFLQKDETQLQDIREDFLEYKARRYDEHTLTTICFDTIVPRDRFIHITFADDTSAIIKSVRRDKWKPKKQGPAIPGETYDYDWDLEPDTTYAVSINMFGVEHHRVLRFEKRQWLADSHSVCPYLTIEYKCSDKTGKNNDATSQLATASMLWLHQRRTLCNASKTSIDGLRHYSIRIFDAEYTVYEASFKNNRCEVRPLVEGTLTSIDGLKKYIEWSNAIHTWGLGPNATSFMEDIKKVLEPGMVIQSLPSPSSIDSAGAHSTADMHTIPNTRP